jgi:hypothetical protein
MRKALLCMAVLLAFGLTAVAQDTSTSGQSSTSTTTTKTTKTKHKKGDMANMGAKSNTITGCIEKSGDDYMIKNGRHKKGVKVTGSDDLSAHVGHTVKLTGNWASASAAPTTATGETKGGGAKMARDFNETKVDMVSETCTMGAGKTMAKKSKKSTSTTPQ